MTARPPLPPVTPWIRERQRRYARTSRWSSALRQPCTPRERQGGSLLGGLYGGVRIGAAALTIDELMIFLQLIDPFEV